MTQHLNQLNMIGEWKNNTLKIIKANEVHMKIDCEPSIRYELSEHFKFPVPGHQFMPAFRNKQWDGNYRCFDARTSKLHLGLLPYVKQFAKEREYTIEYEDENLDQEEVFPLADAKEFADTLNLPHVPRDYQLASFAHAVRNNRALVVSPTASGKSLIIYLLQQWYGDCKTLIIVPTISLVHQMKTDFISYGGNEDDIHLIMSGEERQTDKQVVISTWQSLFRQPKEYFEQYKLVIGDECHLFKAKSLTKIMEGLTECKYRFGFTGTLDGADCHTLILEGLFGKTKQYVKTKDLIEQNHLSKFKIKCLILRHNEDERKAATKFDYQQEMDYLVGQPRRNAFIKNLALSLNGNTLLLFQYVQKHGKILHELIETANTNSQRKIFFVYGGTDATTREDIRAITETEKDAIIIASYGTFSTGINIRNLHNIIFSSPTKSRIRNLQSIGRGLRVGSDKDVATLYDIADDLRHKKKVNYTLEHFAERVNIYDSEEFDYKIHNINL